MPSLQDFATISQTLQGRQQSQQEMKQKMMSEIYLTAIKEKIKGQMQQEKIKAVMEAWRGGGLDGRESIIDAGGKWTVKPAMVKDGQRLQQPQQQPQQQQPRQQTPSWMPNPNFLLTGTGNPLMQNPRAVKPTAPKYVLEQPPAKRRKGFLGLGGYDWNENEFKILQNIRTSQDLQELIRDRKEYEASGVNVQKVIDYFRTKSGTIQTL